MKVFSLSKMNVFISLCFLVFIQTSTAQKDTVHFSKVFNAWKPYRIYLPAGYDTSDKKYAVIYFFHGNQADEKFYLEGLQELVNQASVILVAWNGRSVPKDLRPYNVGYHSNINYSIQFKDYFPEFVAHIDSCYRTWPDRQHRALIGHSMGGFMSFLLAGKYPQMVCAAVSSKGSPEFFVGYPNDHSLYHTRYMFKNLYGVRVRFHNGTDVEELHNLNNEVNAGAVREYGLDYTYHAYEGEHDMHFPEFKDAFDFVISVFLHPLPEPRRWHHADCYASFNVWDYAVSSDLHEPGYIDMKGVTKGGMGIRTRKWEPDGGLIPAVQIKVKTAPVYKPNSGYTLFDYNVTENKGQETPVRSDAEGRISLAVNGQYHQIGINEKNASPEIVFLSHQVDDKNIFLSHKKECGLKIRLLNRGGSMGSGIKVTLTTSAKGVTIANPVAEAGSIGKGQVIWLPAAFKVTASNEPVADGSPFYVRFNLSITDKKGNTWQDEFDAPVFYDVPEFTDIGIDDGDSEIFGSGNGNNIAEPGETIMIYQHSYRTRLYYDDPYIDAERLHDDLQPDKWGDGYALSSLIHISKDCPIGHQIRFLACYEVKEWKTIKRNLTWGVFTITVGDTAQNHTVAIRPGDARIQYEGRIGKPDAETREIYWPGSSARIAFRGSTLKAVLKDEKGFNYFNVIIDDSLVTAIKTDTVKRSYLLASNLTGQMHTVELSKRADWFRGKTGFYGFETNPGDDVANPPSKKRMIEFYGNSITVGAAVEDYHGDSGDGTYTNNYHSYASIIARHFNANYSCIASSGIGVMVSWGSLIMPDIYDRLNPDDSSSKWDFSKAAADLVVVNLFQNDCALVNLPDHAQFKRRFGSEPPSEGKIIGAYRKFIAEIRNRYPSASILCTLGTMDAVKPGSPWPGYIEKAVASLADKKIFTHFMPFLSPSGHPKVPVQQKMAEELISFIDKHIKW